MSEIRDLVKNHILDTLTVRGDSIGRNRIGHVSKLNSDGTVSVLLDSGIVFGTATFPVVIGQEVLAMPANGSYAVLPTSPAPNLVVMEKSPLFTGGVLRMAGAGANLGVASVFLQDLGSAFLLELDTENLLSKLAATGIRDTYVRLSPNAEYLVLGIEPTYPDGIIYDGTPEINYIVQTYHIGKTLGKGSAVPFKTAVFYLTGYTLLQEIVVQASYYSSLDTIPNQCYPTITSRSDVTRDPSLLGISDTFSPSEGQQLKDLAIDNDGNPMWLTTESVTYAIITNVGGGHYGNVFGLVCQKLFTATDNLAVFQESLANQFPQAGTGTSGDVSYPIIIQGAPQTEAFAIFSQTVKTLSTLVFGMNQAGTSSPGLYTVGSLSYVAIGTKSTESGFTTQGTLSIEYGYGALYQSGVLIKPSFVVGRTPTKLSFEWLSVTLDGSYNPVYGTVKCFMQVAGTITELTFTNSRSDLYVNEYPSFLLTLLGNRSYVFVSPVWYTWYLRKASVDTTTDQITAQSAHVTISPGQDTPLISPIQSYALKS